MVHDLKENSIIHIYHLRICTLKNNTFLHSFKSLFLFLFYLFIFFNKSSLNLINFIKLGYIYIFIFLSILQESILFVLHKITSIKFS